jgi:hypothetical protein
MQQLSKKNHAKTRSILIASYTKWSAFEDSANEYEATDEIDYVLSTPEDATTWARVLGVIA